VSRNFERAFFALCMVDYSLPCFFARFTFYFTRGSPTWGWMILVLFILVFVLAIGCMHQANLRQIAQAHGFVVIGGGFVIVSLKHQPLQYVWFRCMRWQARCCRSQKVFHTALFGLGTVLLINGLSPAGYCLLVFFYMPRLGFFRLCGVCWCVIASRPVAARSAEKSTRECWYFLATEGNQLAGCRRRWPALVHIIHIHLF